MMRIGFMLPGSSRLCTVSGFIFALAWGSCAAVPLIEPSGDDPAVIEFTEKHRCADVELYCKWETDTKGDGLLIVSYFGSDHLAGVAFTSTSPNRYWQVKVTDFTFSIGISGIDPPQLTAKGVGTMQHITKADPLDLVKTGGLFSFDMGLDRALPVVTETEYLDDSASGVTDHPAKDATHKDHFNTFLFVRLDPPKPGHEVSALAGPTMTLSGGHPVQGKFDHPVDVILVDAPATPLLMLPLLPLAIGGTRCGRRRRHSRTPPLPAGLANAR